MPEGFGQANLCNMLIQAYYKDRDGLQIDARTERASERASNSCVLGKY